MELFPILGQILILGSLHDRIALRSESRSINFDEISWQMIQLVVLLLHDIFISILRVDCYKYKSQVRFVIIPAL